MHFLYSLAAFAILIGIIVAAHEGGHFLIGRACGIRILEFSLGFGPKLLSWKGKRDETTFTIRAFPIGGFVKPLEKGAVSEEEWSALSEDERSRTYEAAAKWKKLLMVAGGPFANFALAYAAFFVALSLIGTYAAPPKVEAVDEGSVFASSGLKAGDSIRSIDGERTMTASDVYSLLAEKAVEGGSGIMELSDGRRFEFDLSKADVGKLDSGIGKALGLKLAKLKGKIEVSRADEGGVAYAAGLRSGDEILAFDGRKADSGTDLAAYVKKRPGKKVELTISRNGRKSSVSVVPRLVDGFGKIGVVLYEKGAYGGIEVRYPLASGLAKAWMKTVDATKMTFESLIGMASGRISAKEVSGPVAIADYSGKSAERGAYQYVMMLALVSIAIGAFNLLPIPALDGGHLTQYALEFALRRDLPKKFETAIAMIGYGFVFCVFSLAMWNDLSRYLF